jgi:phospholipase/lecithinase/hemolysin
MTTGRFHAIEKFTRRTLEQCVDWNDWAQSEYKQLDQYNKQDMFGAPVQTNNSEINSYLATVQNRTLTTPGIRYKPS